MKKNCKNCNVEFETPRKEKQYCSDKCFQQYRKRSDVILETLKKRREFNLKKYGVDNPSKSNEVKEKTKQTCLKKYGVTSPTLNKEIHNKQIKTNLKKYGVKNPQQNKNIQKKQQRTLFENYGVYIPLKNENLKQKSKQTSLIRYGVDNPSKSNEVKEKTKQTCLKKYGTISPSINDTIKNKQIKKRHQNHFNKLVTSSKFLNVLPLFTINEYEGNISYQKKYPFQCKNCSTNFEDTLLSGHIPRCPKCYPPKESYLETDIFTFLTLYLPANEIERKNKSVLDGLELDIYIPSRKLAIECNGLYWHSEISGKKYKNYHINKTEKCEKKNIKLIHIFEDEWIEKSEIVGRRLKHILNTNRSNHIIFARKCEIKEITSNESNTFLNQYHLQGEDNAPIRFGAFYKNALVSIMTFGKLRLALGNKKPKDNEYEMYRFCVSDSVVGIGGKLLTCFIKKYNPQKIISYADRRWSPVNSFYNKIGFKLISKTPPNYWYINIKNYHHRYYRFNFRKDQLSKKLNTFDPSLTEWENMQLNGFDRIWDCGNLKYEWIK